MKFLFAVLLLFSTSAFADECNFCPKKPVPKPKLKPQVVTVVKKETVTQPCCEKPGNINTNTATSTTGNQTVTVNIPPAQSTTRVYKIVRIKGDDVVHKVYVYRPNRLLLNLGLSKTKLDVTTDACQCTIRARKKDQFDIGAQYLRDFGHLTMGIQGTVHENRYFSIGFNF